MEFIKLTASDADRLLCYFRHELEEENKKYEAAKEVMQAPEKKDDPIRCLLFARVEAAHAHNVKVITRNIELLTCGSEGVKHEAD